MENKTSDKIYKENVKFEVIKIDFSEKTVKSKIEDINKKQEEILNRKVVDVERLNDVVLL
ncbi:MAG: hypothetical protein COZ21_10515 [Bacteroidetes bacterium CG_4_10_14_3_um_filter_31_20]|nr:hypothetical protein [Bacteroidota bacterium]PIY03143.1 MAG: hypothetical protein COZ21_10515 [Bacteroidetes bacterium CG_4_10_14_3_um_filter_31_20]